VSIDKPKVGVLLSNIGTPKSPSVEDVGNYLKEFLMDPFLLPLPYLFRWLLVHRVIVPKRAASSAQAYGEIWSSRGSPLMAHMEDLLALLESNTTDLVFELGMAVGTPSLEQGVRQLQKKGVGRILLAPLYPQYARATYDSSVRLFARALKKTQFKGDFKVLPPFFDQDAYLQYFTQAIQAELSKAPAQKVLFSFHGLPESEIKRTGGQSCLTRNCCDAPPEEVKARCYRYQCLESVRLITQRLSLKPESYETCFQSRLGKKAWLSPYTDSRLRALPGEGCLDLVLVAPSFVVDCLETLEELGIQGKKTFLEAGGRSFRLVSCPNASQQWAPHLLNLIRESVNFSSS